MSEDGQMTRADFGLEVPAWFKTFSQSSEVIGAAIGQALLTVTPTLAAFGAGFAELRRTERLFEESGWLPHAAVPSELIKSCQNAEEFSASLDSHLRANWKQVRSDIEGKVAGLDINKESKDTFGEALAAHEMGLYRCVVRTLLPEIERSVRIDLNQGELSDPKESGATLKADHLLKEGAGDLGFSEMDPGGAFAFVLYQKLKDHLFRNIRTDKSKLEVVERDPVPNRHAALHGLVSYTTHKNAVNAIFFTQYLFQVIAAVKSSSP